MRAWQGLGMMAEVPFPDAGRGIAQGLEMICDAVFGRVQAVIGSGEKHAFRQAHSFWITAGEKCGARWRANRAGDHEVRELAALLGHFVDVRRFDVI